MLLAVGVELLAGVEGVQCVGSPLDLQACIGEPESRVVIHGSELPGELESVQGHREKNLSVFNFRNAPFSGAFNVISGEIVVGCRPVSTIGCLQMATSSHAGPNSGFSSRSWWKNPIA